MSGETTSVGRNRRAITVGVSVGALVLIAIAIVLAASFLSDRDGSADASATPTPTGSLSREPSGSPSSPAAESPAPSAAPPLAETDAPFAAEVLVDDLQVRESAVDGDAVASVSAGDVVVMTGSSEDHDGVTWYDVEAPGGAYGWVSAGPVEDPYLDLRYRLARRIPPAIDGMAGGAGGVLAWGTGERVSTEPATAVVAVRADDGRWTSHTGPFDPVRMSIVTAAYGPGGWVMAASDETNEGVGGAWRSGDGVTWEEIVLALPERVVPRSLAGSASGYALEARDDRTGTSRSAVFLSHDGVAWEPVEVPLESAEVRLAAVGEGILAWSEHGDGSLFLRWSPDAASWVDPTQGLTTPSQAGGALVAEAGDRLVTITFEGIENEVRVWTSQSPASDTGALSWSRQTGAEASLAGAAIGRLINVGDRVVAIGQATADGRIAAWRTADGATWEPIDTGAIAESGVHHAAATGEILAAVGSEVTDGGPNPRFWSSTAGEGWTVEADPALAAVESAVVGSCPPSPTTMLEWMAIPDAIGAECFGDESVTFAAWLTRAGGCGGFVPGRSEPAWLAAHFAEGAIILEPMESPDGGCGSAAAAPGLAIPDELQWVTLTGHWADPASSSCRYLPDPRFPSGAGSADLALRCRLVFVATSLEPTGSP